MKNLVVSELAEVRGRFFASDPAGTKHGNLLVSVFQILIDEFWELRESFCLWVDCAIKCALDKFVIVSAVDEYDIGVLNEGIPLRG